MTTRLGLSWLLRIAGGFGVVATSFGITLAILNYMDGPTQTAATNKSRSGETITGVTGLPVLAPTLGSPKWNTMEGVVARALPISSPAGQQALQIVSTSDDGNKQISVTFTGLAPRRYRAVVLIKRGSTSRLILELRGGGAYGLVTFDLDHRETAGVQGDVQSQGLEQVENGWLRMWAEATTHNTADFFVSVLLSGAGRGAQRDFTIGGVRLEPVG
jgi:hypothetical protein